MEPTREVGNHTPADKRDARIVDERRRKKPGYHCKRDHGKPFGKYTEVNGERRGRCP